MRLLLLLLVPLSLSAFELQPWFTPSFQPEVSLRYRFQCFNNVDGGDRFIDYHSRDHFIRGGAAISLFNEYDIQTEVVGADTRAHNFNFDHAAIMGRYLIMDDVVANPVSWTIGATLSGAITQAVRDISSFHHGNLEGEIHTAVGKEITCLDTWRWHSWILGAIGIADVGSPWIRGNAATEYQTINRCWRFRGAVETLWGLGGRNIDDLHHFKGYGPVRHRSVDLSLRITKQIDFCGTAYIEYARRVYSKNFPHNANQLSININYNIGL